MFALLALIASGLLWPCAAHNVSTYDFLSRPDILAPVFHVRTLDASAVGDGYVFVAPKTPPPRNFTRGGYIYNNEGSLVWSSQKLTHEPCQMSVFDVCPYRDAASICLTVFCGHVGGAGNGSYSLVLDEAYAVVRTVAPSWRWHDAPVYHDMHEFHVVDDAALITSYASTTRPTTFHRCPGAPTVTRLTTGIFTAVALDGTNRTLFAWNALDHVDPAETVLCPGRDTASWGNSSVDGVDFLYVRDDAATSQLTTSHINAVDRNAAGDYLVCARHTSAIYKVAGENSPSGKTPGAIIWRLGGRKNDFRLHSAVDGAGGFNFSFQHHARFIPGGIRLFDNGNSEQAESAEMDAVHASARASSGMDVALDEARMVATLVYQAVAPSGRLDHSQGSHQGLPNGNHLVGMGSLNEVFERTSEGELVFDAFLSGDAAVASYRASRHPWTGRPPPSELALFTYAHNATAPVAYYVSWNGATEVYEYRFFTSNRTASGFQLAATAAKTSEFETTALGHVSGSYSYAEAFDGRGIRLGRTSTVRTFVPAADIAATCSTLRCAPHTDYHSLKQGAGPGIIVKYVGG